MAESPRPHRGEAPPNDALSAAQPVFPTEVEEFEHDHRVTYSQLEQKWLLDDEDGVEWEYIPGAKTWAPPLDQDKIEQQRSAYGAVGENGDSSETGQKKRKYSSEHPGGSQSKAKKRQESDGNQTGERKNTAVYVSSLPLNTTEAELREVFSKYGVIAEEIDTKKPRIKLYFDENNNFKGDALIVYFRPESVQLAVDMLDDSTLKVGQKEGIRVREADMSYKKETHKTLEERPPEERVKKVQQQKKVIAKTQEMNNKLADWDDDDPAALPQTSSRWDQVVVLKYMFNLKELEEDPSALLEIKEDIREECEKLGPVTKVVLFDKEPAGVVTVRFANAEAASACIRMMDGRNFDGQQVVAYVYDGYEKFQKSKDMDVASDDDGDDDDERNEAAGSTAVATED